MINCCHYRPSHSLDRKSSLRNQNHKTPILITFHQCEMPKFPPLLSILYCEFNNTTGPKLLLKIGKDVPLDFDSISDYIIPKSSLIQTLITIETDGLIIMGYPVKIENGIYERNALIFNLCFVLGGGDVGCYEQVVKKMARILRSLEVKDYKT